MSNACGRLHSRRLVVEIWFQSLFAFSVFVELHEKTRLRQFSKRAAGIEPACSVPEPVEGKQLTTSPNRESVDWEHAGDSSWPLLTRDVPADEPPDRQLQYVSQAWHLLPQHVRQAILTLVDAGH